MDRVPTIFKYSMVRKYSVLVGIFISLMLLLVATLVYPGGSIADKNSIGFDWSKNFFSNLFDAKAVNGKNNPARVWADIGMIFLSLTFALFFIGFSRKIPSISASRVIKYIGAGGMLFTFLIITPWHDMMITISSTMFLLSVFYITVFVFKSRLHLMKVMCVICLLLFYYNSYLFGIRDLELLPVMQKVTFAASIILVVVLEYFTKKEDFVQRS